MVEYLGHERATEKTAVFAGFCPLKSMLHMVLGVLTKSRFLRMKRCINFTPHLMNFYICSLLEDETSSQALVSLSFHHLFLLSNLHV